jgi:hypothetical protein
MLLHPQLGTSSLRSFDTQPLFAVVLSNPIPLINRVSVRALPKRGQLSIARTLLPSPNVVSFFKSGRLYSSRTDTSPFELLRSELLPNPRLSWTELVNIASSSCQLLQHAFIDQRRSHAGDGSLKTARSSGNDL